MIAVDTDTMRHLCRGDAEYCKNLVRSLAGENCCFDIHKVNDYLRFGPQLTTSTRNLAHLAQMDLLTINIITVLWRMLESSLEFLKTTHLMGSSRCHSFPGLKDLTSYVSTIALPSLLHSN